jgi:triacylglycerol lipase
MIPNICYDYNIKINSYMLVWLKYIKKVMSKKQKVFVLSFVICTIGFLIVTYFLYNERVLEKSVTQNNGNYVVLLHGLGRTSWSMQQLGLALVDKGYKVININYPTKSDTIENLVENTVKNELEQKYIDKTKQINFVTHSMGGIVVRHLLENNKFEQLNKVVMLAPPNHGSDMADMWSDVEVMNHVLGPALKQLTTDETSFVNTMAPPEYEVGVIVGENDEKVSPEKAMLENMTDYFVVQKKEHTYIMNDPDVIRAVIRFLENGEFSAPGGQVDATL